MSVNLKFVRCPLCNHDNTRLIYPATLKHKQIKQKDSYICTSPDLSNHGDIVQCKNCKMVYNNPQPDADQLINLYKEVVDPSYILQSKGRKLTFKHTITQLQEYIKPPGNLLDVGCYTGIFMESAIASGWRVYGVELSSWAASIAQKLGKGTVFKSTLDQIPLHSSSMDVVTMWDVIEHLSKPKQILENIASLLRPGGILALSTYMIDSFAVKVLGRKYPFFMDMHVVHFSRDTLSRMLSMLGFEILSIRKHKRTIMLDYLLDRTWNLLPALKPMLKPLAGSQLIKKPITLSFMGLVNVYARKKKS